MKQSVQVFLQHFACMLQVITSIHQFNQDIFKLLEVTLHELLHLNNALVTQAFDLYPCVQSHSLYQSKLALQHH